MREVQINSVCDVGSTGRIAADLCRKSIAEGNECIVAYGRDTSSPTDIQMIKVGNRFDFYHHILMTRLFDKHGLASKRATARFLKKMDEYKPELFHLHNLHGYYINYPMLFGYIKENEISVRWTFHDSWPFTGHCAGPSCYDCFRFKEEGCKDCEYYKEYPSSWFYSRSEKNFEEKKNAFLGVKDLKIITPSNWLAGLVKESFLGCYPIEVVHNTIDYETFKPTESDFRKRTDTEGKIIYLCVSFAWIAEKLKSFIQIADLLNDNEVMVLVGLSDKLIKTIKHPKIIKIAKTDSKKELAEIYSAANVFVNPTVKDDNYPTVNLEAQACGTPVVTYNSGGAPETLQEGMGTVVEYGDIDGILREARKVVYTPRKDS